MYCAQGHFRRILRQRGPRTRQTWPAPQVRRARRSARTCAARKAQAGQPCLHTRPLSRGSHRRTSRATCYNRAREVGQATAGRRKAS